MNSRQSEPSPGHRAIVMVASSAGGVQGLQTLLGGLGADLPASVLVAQHLRRSRRTHIVAVLSRATGLRVKLADDGEHPQAGCVHIAPPDHHLCVTEGGTLALTQQGPVNYARPAADPSSNPRRRSTERRSSPVCSPEPTATAPGESRR